MNDDNAGVRNDKQIGYSNLLHTSNQVIFYSRSPLGGGMVSGKHASPEQRRIPAHSVSFKHGWLITLVVGENGPKEEKVSIVVLIRNLKMINTTTTTRNAVHYHHAASSTPTSNLLLFRMISNIQVFGCTYIRLNT
jgi:hypothetical protein